MSRLCGPAYAYDSYAYAPGYTYAPAPAYTYAPAPSTAIRPGRVYSTAPGYDAYADRAGLPRYTLSPWLLYDILRRVSVPRHYDPGAGYNSNTIAPWQELRSCRGTTT